MDGQTVGAPREGSVRWWLVAAISGAVIVTGLIIAIALIWRASTRERDAALEWQQHSYEVVVLARTLNGTLAQSEAALGRFVVSGDKDKGRQFLNNWRLAETLIDQLDSQVTDPEARGLIDQLRQSYSTRGAELNAIALRTNYEQNAQALSKFYTAGNSEALRQMGSLLEQIDQIERRLLEARNARAQATIDNSNTWGGLVGAVGLMLVAGIIFIGWSALQTWRRSVVEVIRSDELEHAVETRTSELREVNELLLEEMKTREEAEARLRQAHKMEAVGQLTGGIAHDFNNMLAVVIGGLEIAKRRIGQGPEAATPHIDNAMEGATRAAALTKRLLAFSRAEPVMAAAADPNGLLKDMAELLDRTIGEQINVRVLPLAGAWPVFIDPHQFENAVLNLAVNGRDAMPSGGTLTITVGNVGLDEEDVPGAPAGDYVRVAVTDTGTGMAPDIRDRVFEPFFTTKPLGSGTGLGLSQVFGFVRQSGGGVSVDSEPGTGTTVAMFLPRSAELPRVEAPSSKVHAIRAPALSAHTILVVEDDQRVLTATAEALRELGHRPIPCPSAAGAAECLRDHPDIALIISDVLMPGMTGPELIAELKDEYPDLPVLFVTGFAGDIEEGAFGGHRVLRKPFTIATLDAAVSTLLKPVPARAA